MQGTIRIIAPMKKRLNQLLCSIACTALFVLAPLSALADGASTNSADMTDVAQPQMLITEFQTGSSTSGKDEFIELYNTTSAPINIANWQIRYISANSSTASLENASQTITIAAPADSTNLFVPPTAYFVLHTSTVPAPANTLAQVYNYTLPASGGSLALFASNSTTCQYVEIDAVAWGGGAFGQSSAIAGLSKDADYQRYIKTNGQYIESYVNSADFGVAAASTPGVSNVLQAPALPSVAGVSPPSVTFANTACTIPIATPPIGTTGGSGSDTPPATNPPTDAGGGLQSPGDGDTPPAGGATGDNSGEPSDTSGQVDQSGLPRADLGLTAPQLTELLPNPQAPQTDASDEFVEIYNVNDVPFDLSGFILEAGLTTLHHFAFPVGTMLAPHSFTAFFSADTGLNMSNTSGQVSLLDPNGSATDTTEAYGAAPDGEAWALANGKWVWTTTPTPNTPNDITMPPALASKAVGKASATIAAAKKTTVGKPKKAAASATKSVKAKSSSTKTVAAKIAGSINPAAAPMPVHASVLAFAALFAILYGAYEYRGDLANRLYQFRSYRRARSQARRSIARERGD